jgi:NitT/TauT family transport system ATP-binding protein
MEPLLTLTDVDYTYQTPEKETPAIRHLNFSVCPDRFLGIIGPSGCGKSTILSLIAGLILPSSGTIRLQTDVSSTSGIGYMLQKDHLLDWLTIKENVALGLKIHRQLTSEKEKWIDGMLSEYGLAQFADVRPSQLSGGMRQRAALIRTLALEPKLLLLDEPFSALDYQTRLTVADDIYHILRCQHKSAILVTHDISEAVSFCDQIIVLTRRPATVKKAMDIQLTLNDEKTPFHARMAPEFKDYFNQIWGELNECTSSVT